MPFVWVTTPQPVTPAPTPIPSTAISYKVDLVANSVNVGCYLSYNTTTAQYDIICPPNAIISLQNPANTWNTINISNANIASLTVNTATIGFANLTSVICSNLTIGSMNLATLYSPLIITGTVSADPTTPLGIASKQYVDAHFVGGSGGGTEVGQISLFAGPLPNGWIEAIQQDISRTSYASLFSRVKTTFGIGDGTTTFGCPVSYSPIAAWRGGANSNNRTTMTYAHTVTPLPDGRFLKIGGSQDSIGGIANTFFGSPTDDTINWIEANSLPITAYYHSTTLITNTRILVVGGYIQANTFFGDIVGNTINWTSSTALPNARYMHTTVLVDGKLVVTGGIGAAGNYLQNVYIGTISTNAINWIESTTRTAGVNLARHETIPLPSGYILHIGGANSGAVRAQTVFMTLQNSGTSITFSGDRTFPPGTSNGRLGIHGCRLQDGRIFIGGGHNGITPQPNCYIGYISNATIQLEESIPLPIPLYEHTITYSPNTKQIFVIGGHDGTRHRGEVWMTKLLTVGVKS